MSQVELAASNEEGVIMETRVRRTDCAAFTVLVESPCDDGCAARDVSALPRFTAGDGVSDFDVTTLESVQPDAAEPSRALRFETLSSERGGALLMIVPRGLDVRINGLPAPRVALLAVADQVQVARAVLHVTRERDAEARRPAPEQLGRRCPVCSVAIESDTRIVVHECGALLHAEQTGDRPEADLLRCSSLTCPDCDKPVEIGTGLVYEPEL